MKRIAGLLLATQLAACSGGSGQEGTTPQQPPAPQLHSSSDPTPQASSSQQAISYRQSWFGFGGAVVNAEKQQSLMGFGVVGTNTEQHQVYGLFGMVMSSSSQPQGQPWTGLTPATETTPWSTLTPATETTQWSTLTPATETTPWSTLTPATETTPWSTLTPATQIQEWTNLEPARHLSRFEKVEQAIEAEDASLTTEEDLIDYSLGKIAYYKARREILVKRFMRGVKGPLSWIPTHDASQLFNKNPERNTTVLFANQNKNGDYYPGVGLLVVGERQQQRYAAMSSPMYATNYSEETDTISRNVVDWLTRGEHKGKPISVVATHVDNNYFHHNTENLKRWLDTQYPNNYTLNNQGDCDDVNLQSCIETRHPDLIVIGQRGYSEERIDQFYAALETAKAEGIPLLVANSMRGIGGLLQPLMDDLGIGTWSNYWDGHRLVNTTIKSQLQEPSGLTTVKNFLNHLKNRDVQFADFGCMRNGTVLLWCGDESFKRVFKDGADWYRNKIIDMDKAGIDVFKTDGNALLKAGVLLADTYRQHIDYPIPQTEPAEWQQAMFADFVINYARATNKAQPDLGIYLQSGGDLKRGENATYPFPETVTETSTISVPYNKQWTTTGWYMLPGHAVTFTRKDESAAKAIIRLNYHRPATNKATLIKTLRGPLEVSTQRVPLAAGQSVTVSSPYGGPIYMYLEGDNLPLAITVEAKGVAKHPSLLEPTPAEYQRFDETLASNELPHVDFRINGAEYHSRRDRFEWTMANRYDSLEELVVASEKDQIGNAYTLAGLIVPGYTLDQTLPEEVKTLCSLLFGEDDCLDSDLHDRKLIQHANYDESASCGDGCSGYPRDADWSPDPRNWYDNHEVGHNLQTNYLNTAYVPAGHEQEWEQYSNRATENSNNIFPWYINWKSHYEYYRDGYVKDNQENKDAFFVYMSDALNLHDANGDRVVYDAHCNPVGNRRGVDRYVAPWENNSYSYFNGFRQSFYMQMILRSQNQTVTHGRTLTNGFDLFTLLYEHSRIFNKYAQSEELWNAHRDRLGFGKFPYSGGAPYGNRKINGIPGNDFLLVSLSKITNKDWRPFFDMYGLHYTNLAAEQAQANATQGPVEKGLIAIDSDIPPEDMVGDLQFLPLDGATVDTVWPTTANNSPNSPAQCRVAN